MTPLLNMWNKFQLINNSCFYFELWALLNCPTFVFEWSHVRIPKPSNQSELWHLDTCLLTRLLFLFSHEMSNSVHFATKFSVPVSFSSVFWKAVNFARIYAGAAAAAGLVEIAFCVVFLTHKLHMSWKHAIDSPTNERFHADRSRSCTCRSRTLQAIRKGFAIPVQQAKTHNDRRTWFPD